MRVLLAEDDQNISMIATLTLENMGQHTVVHVDNGEDALRKAIEEDFDVILLDEMMPKMNGLRVCQEFRSKSTKKTPVIFLSAKSQQDDIKLFKEIGTGYIAKPFDPMSLCQEIDDILRASGALK